jgi:glyoxylate utilization-related uncharacterized protein
MNPYNMLEINLPYCAIKHKTENKWLFVNKIYQPLGHNKAYLEIEDLYHLNDLYWTNYPEMDDSTITDIFNLNDVEFDHNNNVIKFWFYSELPYDELQQNDYKIEIFSKRYFTILEHFSKMEVLEQE